MTATPQETVLVIDDNEANRSLATATLEDEDYRVVTASGGIEGIAVFEREAPGCVLLDVRMPDLDGFAVCKRIRALPGGTDTPILFFTALRDVDTFDEALRVGGDDFLTKPIRPTELLVRVQTALKLRRLGAELREHYDLLRRQRDDLLRLQLQKERLMAFVVHDLKNPVNAMDLHAQLLLRTKDMPASAVESARQIRTEARHLTRMIVNLLDMSKADEGQLMPRPTSFDPSRLVDEVVAELGASAEARRVALRSSIKVGAMRGDEDLLRRTLTNLTENAIRYAPPESEVTITAERTEGAVELRVADRGRGIPEDMRDKVFDPFVQVESGEELVARTSRGLGLSFCRAAIEAHGGRIWIEDGAPGTVFGLSLPDVA